MNLFIYSEEQNGHMRRKRILRGYWDLLEHDYGTVRGGSDREEFISILTTSLSVRLPQNAPQLQTRFFVLKYLGTYYSLMVFDAVSFWYRCTHI
jgi:hypothetical protein